jgi:hypothetical protein
MPAKKSPDRIGTLVKEVEDVARDLRAQLRKREAAVEKNLRKAANELRKRAVVVAGQVEKYAHQMKLQLEGSPARKAAAAARKRKR